MANLTAALARPFELGDMADIPVKASTQIYQGSAIGLTSGYARHVATTDRFVGFAEENALGTASDGGVTVRVRTRGRVLLTIASVAVTDIGKPVYASDGNAFTLTQGTSVHIGRVVRVAATNTAVVEFDASRASVGALTEFTDNSGGTASDTIAAIGGTYSQAEVRNAVASLAAKITAIVRQLG